MREELKRQVETCIDRCSGELTELADTIWNNPEYNFKEYKACRSITGLLENHGFEVERGTGGIETAFHAFCDSGKPGPHIAFLAEYDAVPGMGHACGHNLMAAMSAAIKEVMKLPEDKKGVLSTPEWLNSPFFSLTKVGFVAFLATQIAPFTGISAAVWALVLGVGACALGFLESNVLVKANSMQILMFALMMFVFDGLKVCTPEMLVNLILPCLVLIGVGLAGMAVFAIGACFVLKVSPWLGFANALTALYGFPFNQILTEQICDQLAKTPEERDYLMSRMFPSMIVGGFVTVTVASVIIAGFFVDMF